MSGWIKVPPKTTRSIRIAAECRLFFLASIGSRPESVDIKGADCARPAGTITALAMAGGVVQQFAMVPAHGAQA
jgi:hypothetical protein